MPVRMDAPEGYRPLPPVVKVRGPAPDPGRAAYLVALPTAFPGIKADLA
jgi:hypothetical protein